MRRKSINSINIWPGFVDAISTLLLVFVFLLAIFMISQSFLTQAISGKDIALDNLRIQLMRLDQDLKANKKEKAKLSDLILNLNLELKKTSLDKEKKISELKKEQSKSKILQINTEELESKLAMLYEEIGIEKLNFKKLESEYSTLKISNSDLNDNINVLNDKLSKLDNKLNLKTKEIDDKNNEVADLSEKLNLALQERMGELEEYRSEFFGRLKEVIGSEKEISIVGDRFVLQSEIFFQSGSANLGEVGQKKIIEITNILKFIANKIPEGIDWIIQVEGHTDDVPISTDNFPSNWELSAARAIEVAKIMMQNGLQSNRINVAGYGEFRPLRHLEISMS